MQMRAGGKSRVAGIGDILTAFHPLARSHANRIPAQMGIKTEGAVVVENADNVRGGGELLRVYATAKITVRDRHDQAAQWVMVPPTQ